MNQVEVEREEEREQEEQEVSPRNMRTVFLQDGKEVLDNQGKSALLYNLKVLAHQQQNDHQQQATRITLKKEERTESNNNNNNNNSKDKSFLNKLSSFAQAAELDLASSDPEHRIGGERKRLKSLGTFQHKSHHHHRAGEKNETNNNEKNPDQESSKNNNNDENNNNNNQAAAVRKGVVINQGLSEQEKEQLQHYHDCLLRLTVFEGLVPTLHEAKFGRCPAFRSLHHTSKKFKASKFYVADDDFDSGGGGGGGAGGQQGQSPFFTVGESRKKSGGNNDVSITEGEAVVAAAGGGGADDVDDDRDDDIESVDFETINKEVPVAMTCPHCKLTADVPPASHVRPLTDSFFPRARYLVAKTAMSENELDERLWRILTSLTFSPECSSSSAEEAAKKKKKKKKEDEEAESKKKKAKEEEEEGGEHNKKKNEEEDHHNFSQTSFGDSCASTSFPAFIHDKHKSNEDYNNSNSNIPSSHEIAEHFEFRVGAPPWHEYWTRLERVAQELRDRKLSNNEHNKTRLIQLQHEHSVIVAQVKALTIGLLEVNPIDKVRSLETDEQRANYEANSYYEAIHVIEDQLRHLDELEKRCLMHTAVTIEEARRAANTVNDFADFVSHSPDLLHHIDVKEVGELLGDLLACTPVVAKDDAHEAEQIANRKNAANTSTQRFQCKDCLLMCQYSRYCPMTGKMHPTLPVPGADDEDDLFSSAAALKASLLIAEGSMDASATGRDRSPLAKMMMAVASLERQRIQEEEEREQKEKEQEEAERESSPKPYPPPPPPPHLAASSSSPGAGGGGVASSSSSPLRRSNSSIRRTAARTMSSFRSKKSTKNKGGGKKKESSTSQQEQQQQIHDDDNDDDNNGDDENVTSSSSSSSSSASPSPQHQQQPQPSLLAAALAHGAATPLQLQAEASPSGLSRKNSHNRSFTRKNSGHHHHHHHPSPSSSSAASPFSAFSESASPNNNNIKSQFEAFGASSSATAAAGGGSEDRRRHSNSASSYSQGNHSQSQHHGRSGSFLLAQEYFIDTLIRNDAEAERFMEQHVSDILGCAVRRDIEGLRWHNHKLNHVLTNTEEINKHIPKVQATQIMDLEKMFTEWFAAMVRRQREDAKIAKISAGRISYADGKNGATTQSLRRGMLEDRVRKHQREIRELQYSIAKRPKHKHAAEVDDDVVFESLALRVRNLQRKKGGLRGKIRQQSDEVRAINHRIAVLNGDLLSPRELASPMSASGSPASAASPGSTMSSSASPTFASALAASSYSQHGIEPTVFNATS